MRSKIRNIALATEIAPNASAMMVVGLVPDNTPKPQNKNIDQRITLVASDQATGLDRLQRHQEASLLHQREIRFGPSKRVLLGGRFWIERFERAGGRPPTLESDVRPELRRVGVRAPPE